ncbi:hypothetical protein BKH45_05715 [Helicobacter sp. 11S03491-1]|nr:hypothetical protein BKH45_05715 [Helicobacter sp. 11S03491-1]
MKNIRIPTRKYIIKNSGNEYPKTTESKNIKKKKNETWKVKNVRVLQAATQKPFKLFSFFSLIFISFSQTPIILHHFFLKINIQIKNKIQIKG